MKLLLWLLGVVIVSIGLNLITDVVGFWPAYGGFLVVYGTLVMRPAMERKAEP